MHLQINSGKHRGEKYLIEHLTHLWLTLWDGPRQALNPEMTTAARDSRGWGGLRVKLTPHYSFRPKTVINLDGFSLCPCALKLAGPRSTEETRLKGRRNTFGPWTPPSVYVSMKVSATDLPSFPAKSNKEARVVPKDGLPELQPGLGNGLSSPVENQGVCLKTPFGCFLEFLLAVNFASMWQSLSQENVENYGWGQEESIICFPKRRWGKRGDKLHS